MRFIRDLWMGQGNLFWELARILSTLCVLSMFVGLAWNIHLGQPIDLGPAGLGGGLAGVLGAAAALIALKDRGTRSAPAEEGAA